MKFSEDIVVNTESKITINNELNPFELAAKDNVIYNYFLIK